MRVDALHLERYGPFTDKRLDLRGGEQGLHVVFGPNEAGKSTALRALLDWWFGIPERTTMNFVHPMSKLRVGGVVRLRDGSEFEVYRRKGRGSTLSTASGEASEVFAECFGDIDRGLFEMLFGLDHARLREGSDALLQSDSPLGQILLGAAVGSGRLRRVEQDLRQEADKLFRPRASKPHINALLRQYKDARRRVRDAALHAEEWDRHRRELDEVEEALRQHTEERRRVADDLALVKRVAAARGLMARLREVEEELSTLHNVPLLPAEFAQEVREARERLGACEASLRAAEDRVREVEERLQGVGEAPEEWSNALEDAIRGLLDQRGAIRKADQDAGKRAAAREEAFARAREVLRDIDLDEPPDAAAPRLRRWRTHRKAIRTLLKERSELAQQLDVAQREFEDAQAALEAREEELASLPDCLDPAALDEAIERVRRAGDVEGELAAARNEAAAQEAAAALLVRRMGRVSGAAAEVADASWPAEAEVDEFDERFRRGDEALRDARRRVTELESQLRSVERELAELVEAQGVRHPNELAEAREVRGGLWRAVREVYVERAVDPGDRQVVELTGGRPLVEAYEESVESADRIADELYDHADAVSRRVQLERQQRRVQEELDEARAALERAVEERSELEDAWQALWKGLSGAPGAPSVMRRWLVELDKLRGAVDAGRRAGERASKLEDQRNGLANDLRAALRAAGAGAPDDASLDRLLDVAVGHAAQLHEALRRRALLERQCEEARQNVDKRRRALETAKRAMQGWQPRWAACVSSASLPPDALPAAAETLLDAADRFLEEWKKVEDLDHRIQAMAKDRQRFEREARELAAKLALDVGRLDALEIAGVLERELERVRKVTQAQEELSAARAKRDEARRELDRARRAIDELCRRAGVDDAAHLDPVLERVARRRRLEEQRDELKQQLAEVGEGRRIEELRAERAQVAERALDRRALEEHLADLDTAIGQLRERRGQLRQWVAERESEEGAAGPAQELASIESAIEEAVERYAVLTLAHGLLRELIERFRKRHQSPVLERAGRLFSELTRGAFARLRVVYDGEDRPARLLAVREASGEEVPLEGLSDGTRDQLFLALRLATSLEMMQGREPLPLILDDVLITFDDARADACLEALAQVSKQTQVLLFTHHQRVAESARALATRTDVFVHTL